MANNRLYLKCNLCGERFYMAKYYPSSGWYTNLSDMTTEEEGVLAWYNDLQEFFDEHSPYVARGLDGRFTLARGAPNVLHGDPNNEEINFGRTLSLEYE